MKNRIITANVQIFRDSEKSITYSIRLGNAPMSKVHFCLTELIFEKQCSELIKISGVGSSKKIFKDPMLSEPIYRLTLNS